MPSADMWVSPQHRMLVQSQETILNFGEHEILAPAKGLVNGSSIHVDNSVTQATYIHILFDKHQIIFANGVPSESFHPGVMAMRSIDKVQKKELIEIFPELVVSPADYGQTARTSLTVSETRTLAFAA